MPGETRHELVSRWPEVATRGVADEGGKALLPGDLVRLPVAICAGSDAGWDVPGTIVGFAIGRAGARLSWSTHRPMATVQSMGTWHAIEVVLGTRVFWQGYSAPYSGGKDGDLDAFAVGLIIERALDKETILT